MLRAASAGLVGVSPLEYLRCQDPFEREVLEAVAETGERALVNLVEYGAWCIQKAVWGG